MKMTYFWIIYLCLIFGSGILCNTTTQNRQKNGDSPSYIYIEEKFYCSDGVSYIEKSRVCDGRKDCKDGSDETKEMCLRNEYGQNNTIECGKVYINQGCICNGQKARVGTAPWNVGIYRLNNRHSNYELICGGSLISSNLIVSAARCFWEHGTSTNRIIKSEGLYKIAVGKYDRNISKIDNQYTQIMDVDTVYLKEAFYGSSGYYAEDIAMVVIKNQVTFSSNVAPVCIDWNTRYNIVNGELGKIVGWGCPNTSTVSNILLELSLPYIDHTSCRNMYKNGFEVYLTADKFCAGAEWVSGQGADVGYGGAGLSFPIDNSYYLTGVTNVKDPYTNNSIALFTEINYHIEWIRGLFQKHHNKIL